MNRLKELRQEKKLTQQELADIAEVSKRTYIYWENGESQIKPDKAQKLADYFGVSVGHLLGFNIADPSDYDIELHNNIVDYIKKLQFIQFLDFLQLAEFNLTDKQIKAFFEQLISTSELNNEYSILENNHSKYRAFFSLMQEYACGVDFLRMANKIYTQEFIERQYELVKKILN